MKTRTEIQIAEALRERDIAINQTAPMVAVSAQKPGRGKAFLQRVAAKLRKAKANAKRQRGRRKTGARCDL